MIRVYCDSCGKEMPGGRKRLIAKLDRVEVEVTVAVDGVWNGGHVCIPCIKLAVVTGVSAGPTTTTGEGA